MFALENTDFAISLLKFWIFPHECMYVKYYWCVNICLSIQGNVKNDLANKNRAPQGRSQERK